MRLQDGEDYQQPSKPGYSENSGHFLSTLPYLFFPAITLIFLWWGADVFLKSTQTQLTVNSFPATSDHQLDHGELKSTDTSNGEIVLKADKQGHFRGTALLNNISVPFMIDTGATKTSVPFKMAIAAGLPFGKQTKIMTAGGQINDQLTRIKSLKIGNAEITHLDANINQHLGEVLIGMNTLKFFSLTQNGDKLILSANQANKNESISAAANNQGESTDFVEPDKLVNKPLELKKTVICNANQVCKTIYSDHAIP